MTKNTRPQSKLLRLIGLTFVVIGLIGLMLIQGISKPESSLDALEPVLPHAVGEIFEDQSVLLSLPIEGVVVFVPPNAFAQSEGRVIASIKNSDQSEYSFKCNWIDYRELNIAYLDTRGDEHSGLKLEKPIEFCFTFSDEKSTQKIPTNLTLPELAFWEYVQENENWRAISTYVPKEPDGSICGKSKLMTKFVLACGSLVNGD